MTETDNHNKDHRPADVDALLEQFFLAAREERLADDGFTGRVMARLPQRQERLSRLWTAACVVAATALFTALGGWQQAALGMARVLTTAPTATQLLQLMLCGAALTTLAATELMWREK